ncbi:unnamed protein product [Closterium sp. NIES-64]|nr:unnamed protein product [Closterium sp. NIES-64]
MSALPGGDERDCHLCVQYDPGIEVAALGASEAAALGASKSAPSGTAPAEALHTFTLDSGAFRCFFRDSTALTPLTAPVAVSLADPSGGSVLARSTTVLPCPAIPSGSLTGFHLPSFSTNLVSNAVLQDQWVDTFTPGGQRVVISTCSRTGRHLATFTRRPGSSLYTLMIAPPHVAATGQVSAPGQVASPCERRSLSHQTLLWHHRLGHPSLPRLRGIHRRLLVSGLPRSLPPLPASPALPCLPCVEGRQRAAPHSSSFPPTEAPLQTLHLDVWGPARVRGQGGERYFLLVVDDNSRYTTVFPLHTKGPPPVDPLPLQGLAPSGVSQVDPPPLAEPVEVKSDSGAAGGAAFEGAEPAREVLGSAEPGGAEPEAAESGGSEPVREVPGGVAPGGAESAGFPLGLVSRRGPVSPQ